MVVEEIDVNSRATLRIGHILKLSWTLFVKNVKAWFLPLVFMDFIAWRLLWDLWDMVPSYIDSMLEVELAAMVLALVDDLAIPGIDDVRRLFVQVSVGIASSILSTVIVSPLIYEAIASGRMRIRSREIVERLKRDDLIAEVMRSAGITFAAFAGMAMAVTALVLLTRTAVPIGATIFAGVLVLIVCLGIMVLSGMAIPVAVVEDAGVVKSVKRSWTLTGRCLMKMIGVLVLTQVLVYAPLFAVAIVVEIAVAIDIGSGGATGSADGSQARVIATTMEPVLHVGGLIGSFGIAIVLSVCYYHLRAAEDGANESS